MKKIKIALVGVLAVFSSCSVLKQSECKKKYVTVTVISKYGTYRVSAFYCDTLYLGEKAPPDSLAIQFKAK
jgi:hypothetical protein